MTSEIEKTPARKTAKERREELAERLYEAFYRVNYHSWLPFKNLQQDEKRQWFGVAKEAIKYEEEHPYIPIHSKKK